MLCSCIEDEVDIKAVGNGNELGLPEVSRDLTTEPVVMGGSLGEGKDCGPNLSTALGLDAGGAIVMGRVGIVAAKEYRLKKTKTIRGSIIM